MKSAGLLMIVALALLLGLTGRSGAEVLYLYADFNDQPLDQPIGTGGAAVGQPVDIDPFVTAIVKADPMGSPSLEIQDVDDYSAGTVRFEFLDAAEITSGHVVIAADLWFRALEDGYAFNLYVREHGSSAESFASIRFGPDGGVSLSDKQGGVGVIGNYETGRRTHVVLDFDMDAGAYSVTIDGVVLVEDREHGITERGIGAVLFGCDNDADLAGVFNVDLITVTDTMRVVASTPSTWGRVKAGYR